MLIFIDESGDAGFKTSKGSSRYFIIALIIFDNEDEAEKVAESIKEYRREIRKNKNFEFKFNKLTKEFRLGFLKKIAFFSFRIRLIVVDKTTVYSSKLRANTSTYYDFFLKQVLEHSKDSILNAKLRIDGSGERKFRKSLLAYLRKSLNKETTKRVMKNLKFIDSKSDLLIQLADIVAGSIHKSYQSGKRDRDVYKNFIKSKIEDEWEFK